MLKIKIPFGFKTISLDNLYVFYTGKIRVKADYEFIVSKLINVNGLVFTKGRRNCVTISYVVTDYTVHNNNIKEINAVLKDIMIDRIERKYGDKFGVIEHTSIIETELPF
jgi:hypothetical protein